MSIKRINEFQAQETKGDECFQFLKSIVPFITSSEGCISCELLRNTDNPLMFVVLEEWDRIESHKKSVQRFPAEQMQAAMSLLGAPPNGNYYQS